MTTSTQTVILRKLTANEGMAITDKATQTMRAEFVFLGKEDTEENYIEIPADTPLPEDEAEGGDGHDL